jgi:hypothetical protein
MATLAAGFSTGENRTISRHALASGSFWHFLPRKPGASAPRLIEESIAMKRLFFPLAGVALVSISLVLAGGVDEPPPEQSSLKGLAGIRLRVDGVGAELEKQGLRKVDLAAAVESQLRKSGIELLAADERAQGLPTLVLHVMGFRADEQQDDLWVYSIDLALEQEVRLVRNPGVKLHAPTWRGKGSVGTLELASLGELRKMVGEQVGAFEKDYLAANAK